MRPSVRCCSALLAVPALLVAAAPATAARRRTRARRARPAAVHLATVRPRRRTTAAARSPSTSLSPSVDPGQRAAAASAARSPTSATETCDAINVYALHLRRADHHAGPSSPRPRRRDPDARGRRPDHRRHLRRRSTTSARARPRRYSLRMPARPDAGRRHVAARRLLVRRARPRRHRRGPRRRRRRPGPHLPARWPRAGTAPPSTTALVIPLRHSVDYAPRRQPPRRPSGGSPTLAPGGSLRTWSTSAGAAGYAPAHLAGRPGGARRDRPARRGNPVRNLGRTPAVGDNDGGNNGDDEATTGSTAGDPTAEPAGGRRVGREGRRRQAC